MSIASDAAAALADGMAVDKATLRSVFSEIDSTINSSDNLASEVARSAQTYTRLEQAIDAETARAEEAEAAEKAARVAETARAEEAEAAEEAARVEGDEELQEQISALSPQVKAATDAGAQAKARLDAAEPAIATLKGRADDVDRTLGQLEQDRDTFRSDLSTKLGTLGSLLGTATLSSRDRVGDNLFLFTPRIDGLGPACPPLPDGGVVVTGFGAVYRATGPQIIARRAPIWLEPDRFHAVRFAVSRLARPSDPDDDDIRCGIACLDQNGKLIATLVVQDITRAPVGGLQVVPTRFPSRPGDPVTLQPPAGTVFWRPYLQTFGEDGTTDFVLVSDQDITDAASYSADVSGIRSQLSALATRLDTLDPLSAGTANGLATLDSTGTVAQLPMLKSAFFAAAEQAAPNAMELVDDAISNLSNSAAATDRALIIAHRNPYVHAGDPWANYAQAAIGLSNVQMAAILAAIGSPSQRAGYVAPNPVFDLDVARAAVLDAARARFATISGASLVAFRTAFIGDEDRPDGSWTAFYADEAAPVGGLLYALMLSYLISPAPGPALSQQAAVAQLTSIWAAAASIPT